MERGLSCLDPLLEEHVMRRLAIVVTLLVMSCGGPKLGRTGNALVDACLHWTACITSLPQLPPSQTGDDFAYCVMGLGAAVGRLPWPAGGVAVSSAQLQCLADSGPDCAKALNCVSIPARTPCPSPTWECTGDILTRCDAFSGSRLVTEDCASAGLRWPALFCTPAQSLRHPIRLCEPCRSRRLRGRREFRPVRGNDTAVLRRARQ